jgi:hypothetical protein
MHCLAAFFGKVIKLTPAGEAKGDLVGANVVGCGSVAMVLMLVHPWVVSLVLE